MKEKIYFIESGKTGDDEELCRKLNQLLKDKDLLSPFKPLDMVAVKTHFGEIKTQGYARPRYFSMLGRLLKEKKCIPFLTETSTLYKGNRSNAVAHLEHAHRNGFGFEHTGLPIIMADGLYGDEEIEVPIDGKIYSSVKLASILVKAQGLVLVSHFTGHLGTGFGAALKNMGMGCSSRKGKMEQHSTAKPTVKTNACVCCGECVRWCPAGAVSMDDKSAEINQEICIGCGQCLAVCRFDAVTYNWGATYEDLQKKIVEHAMGVAATKKGRGLYINLLTRISKDCDCMPSFEQIMPDIGILVSHDPVALDAASLDLVEQRAGKPLSELCYNIPYRFQIDYAKELKFGNTEYELVKI